MTTKSAEAKEENPCSLHVTDKLKLTPEEWQLLFYGDHPLAIKITDPDGWDRRAKKFGEDWKKPLDYREYKKREDQSSTYGHTSRAWHEVWNDLAELSERAEDPNNTQKVCVPVEWK